MKHDLTKVKVACSGKKEAKRMMYVLECLGEEIHERFFTINSSESLYFNTASKNWIVGYNFNDRSARTFAELIKMIVENQSHEETYVPGMTWPINQMEDTINGMPFGVWKVTPIKKSILDGKVAIQVNNEREFKLLMEHYDSKGWASKSGEKPLAIAYSKYIGFPLVSYTKPFVFPNHTGAAGTVKDYELYSPDCYKIIPFSDFAKEAGIKVPVFIMKSEDGVDLYEGDKFVNVYKVGKKWWLGHPECQVTKGCSFVDIPDDFKAFSTREAAEKWIKEKNKPESVAVDINPETSITLTKDGVFIINNSLFSSITFDDLRTLLNKYDATYRS